MLYLGWRRGYAPTQGFTPVPRPNKFVCSYKKLSSYVYLKKAKERVSVDTLTAKAEDSFFTGSPMTLRLESLIGMPYRPIFQPLSHEAEQVVRKVPTDDFITNTKLLTAIHPADASTSLIRSYVEGFSNKIGGILAEER